MKLLNNNEIHNITNCDRESQLLQQFLANYNYCCTNTHTVHLTHTYIHTYIHTFKNNVQQVWLAPGHGYIFDKLFSMIEGHLHYNF